MSAAVAPARMAVAMISAAAAVPTVSVSPRPLPVSTAVIETITLTRPGPSADGVHDELAETEFVTEGVETPLGESDEEGLADAVDDCDRDEDVEGVEVRELVRLCVLDALMDGVPLELDV